MLQVCEDWRVKVCDFGFARKAEKADFLTMCGTDEWMAPEVGLGEKYDARADVFSYGMVLCELVTRRKPPRRQPGKAYAFEVKELKARAPPDTPPELMDLIINCAQFYPERRPTFRDILQDLKELQARLDKEFPNPPPPPPVVGPSLGGDSDSDSDSDSDDSSDSSDDSDSESEESSEVFESSAAADEGLSYGGIVEED